VPDSIRKRISSAAQDLYLREGLEGFSMRKVAELVGISAPAIYRHFRNKDDLLNEIVVEGLRILEQYLRPAMDVATPYERLTRLTERYLDFALEQPQYFDFAFLIPSGAIDRFAEEIARPDWVTFRLAVEQVGSCVSQGIFVDSDPLEAAITIWAEVHGLVTLFRTGRFGPDAELFRQIYRRSVDRVMTGMMSDQARTRLCHDAES
jgi:AcrR family transcriptional regulator